MLLAPALAEVGDLRARTDTAILSWGWLPPTPCSSPALLQSRRNCHPALHPSFCGSLVPRLVQLHALHLPRTLFLYTAFLGFVYNSPCSHEGLGCHKAGCWRLWRMWRTKIHSYYFSTGGLIAGIRRCKTQVMGLGLTGLQEESGLMEMNVTGNRNVFLGTWLPYCDPTLSSVCLPHFFSHQQAAPWPFLCCHSVFAVGLWFLLASAPNTTDSLQGSRPKSLLENKFYEDMDFGFSCLSLVLKKAALPLHKCVALGQVT